MKLKDSFQSSGELGARERHSLTMSHKCSDLLYGCFNEPRGKSLPVVINKYCVSALGICVSAGSVNAALES